jgi:hypothetical protein
MEMLKSFRRREPTIVVTKNFIFTTITMKFFSHDSYMYFLIIFILIHSKVLQQLLVHDML